MKLYILCLGNISKYFTATNMKKRKEKNKKNTDQKKQIKWINEYVYVFLLIIVLLIIAILLYS